MILTLPQMASDSFNTSVATSIDFLITSLSVLVHRNGHACSQIPIVLQHIIKALQYLVWENQDKSLLVLKIAQSIWRRSDPHLLWNAAPVSPHMSLVQSMLLSRVLGPLQPVLQGCLTAMKAEGALAKLTGCILSTSSSRQMLKRI